MLRPAAFSSPGRPAMPLEWDGTKAVYDTIRNPGRGRRPSGGPDRPRRRARGGRGQCEMRNWLMSPAMLAKTAGRSGTFGTSKKSAGLVAQFCSTVGATPLTSVRTV